MKNFAFKYVFVAIFVISLMMPMLVMLVAHASASERTYPAENGWLDVNPNSPDSYAYSIAVVGDTQSLLVKDLTNGTNHKQDGILSVSNTNRANMFLA